MKGPLDRYVPASSWPADWETLKLAVQIRDHYAELLKLIETERSLFAELNMSQPPWTAGDEPLPEELLHEAVPSSLPPARLLALTEVIRQRRDAANERIARMRQALALIASGQALLDAANLEPAVAAFERASSLAPASAVAIAALARCHQAKADARAALAAHQSLASSVASNDASDAPVTQLAGAFAQARSLAARGEPNAAVGRLRDLATDFPGLPGVMLELERLRTESGADRQHVGRELDHLQDPWTGSPPMGLRPEDGVSGDSPSQPPPPVAIPSEPAPAVTVTRNWITVVVAGASGLALLASPAWVPALMSMLRSPQSLERSESAERRSGASGVPAPIATIGTRPDGTAESLIGVDSRIEPRTAFPVRWLDFVGVMKDGMTYRDPEGRFRLDYPSRTWRLETSEPPFIVTLSDNDGNAAMRVELGPASARDRDPDRLVQHELARIHEADAGVEEIVLRKPRPALPLVVVDYRRPTGSDWEQVRHYLRVDGPQPYRLVAIAPVNRFTLVEGVFNLVARSFEPEPD